MANNKDFKVKNGIKPTVYHEGVGAVVSGVSVSGYNLSITSYASKSLSVSAQSSETMGLYFKGDGLSVYVVDATTDNVYQYNLTTAWDISTASYASKSASVSAQSTVPTDVLFNSTGTKMYVVDYYQDVYQYSLSTAWDVSTATYDSVQLDTSTVPTGSLRGGHFKPDGTILYLVSETTPDSIYQYTLSTAYDLSTASYASKSLNVSSQSTTPTDVELNSDGTKAYICDEGTDTIYQYSLSTAWDISTGTYDNVSFSLASQEITLRGVVFGNQGLYLYGVGTANDTIYQYTSGTSTNTASLDLSTGSVFDYTPTSDVQVTLSNPAASGTVSAATLLLSSEDAVGVTGTFDTTTWSGNGSTQTITNNVDLANDGGMVWIKQRNTNQDHVITDTERGAGYRLNSNSFSAQDYDLARLSSFNSDGFSIGNNTTVNNASGTYVGWTFKKSAGFFDVVTYTGNGVSGRQISHNLGTKPGFIIVKRTDTGNDPYNYWRTAHIDGSTLTAMDLNTTSDASTTPWILWSDSSTATSAYAAAQQTSTYFTVGNNASINGSGGSFVAYLFAHDTSADGLIQCGSAISGSTVNLGWEPQFIIGRWSNAASNWAILDTERGFTNSTDEVLYANSAGSADNTNDILTPTSTGFTINSSWWGTTNTFIYIAIRASYVPTITYDPDLQWSGGTAPTAPAIGETDVITINTDDGGTTYKAVQSIDGAK